MFIGTPCQGCLFPCKIYKLNWFSFCEAHNEIQELNAENANTCFALRWLMFPTITVWGLGLGWGCLFFFNSVRREMVASSAVPLCRRWCSVRLRWRNARLLNKTVPSPTERYAPSRAEAVGFRCSAPRVAAACWVLVLLDALADQLRVRQLYASSCEREGGNTGICVTLCSVFACSLHYFIHGETVFQMCLNAGQSVISPTCVLNTEWFWLAIGL